MKILIAEDSSTVRRLVAARLAADGFEVIEAADGEEALFAAQRDEPDLLVLDKVMPKLDGFEVVRALRDNPRTAEVPIVMLTERTSEEDVLSGLNLGVEEYIAKPFSPHELSARVRRVVARAGARGGRPSPAAGG
jgi:DNA-binding response OmpR family regulator